MKPSKGYESGAWDTDPSSAEITQATDFNTATDVSREQYSYLIAGVIGSTIGILHKWIAEDFASPAESIADILAMIFLNGVLPFMGNR